MHTLADCLPYWKQFPLELSLLLKLSERRWDLSDAWRVPLTRKMERQGGSKKLLQTMVDLASPERFGLLGVSTAAQ